MKIVQRITLLKNTDYFIFIHQVFISEILSFSFSHHPLAIFLCWRLLIQYENTDRLISFS